MHIPFNKPHMTGKELWYISQAHHNGQLSGDGPFTKKCHDWLERQTGCCKALLTHSCTAALEMAAILADVKYGDEIIMPSYTFVSTANAFVLRGGVPVFVDIRKDTLNIDETKIEMAITDKTVAIVVVHYGGVGCEMEIIMEIAKRHNLLVIEDAAQGLIATYKKKALGSIGDIGTLSFHETKNITAGEGGALLINSEQFVERAEVIREKGTNRSKYFRGLIDKYTWVDIGSSYLPGELIGAFLYAQLEEAKTITQQRLQLWEEYHLSFADLEKRGYFRRPFISEHCQHNAHMYYILVENLEIRTSLLQYLKDNGVCAVFHYVPLHTSPAGKRYGRSAGDITVVDFVSDRILRLPLYADMTSKDVQYIADLTHQFFLTLKFKKKELCGITD